MLWLLLLGGELVLERGWFGHKVGAVFEGNKVGFG